jgi:hypothetical protein
MVEDKSELAQDSSPEPAPAEWLPDTLLGSDTGLNSAEPDALPGVPTAIKEHPKTMLEVHAPHEALHTWRGFFIHIATIVIGLFIAVGLEQTVVLFEHRHQRAQLEEQLHGVFQSDLQHDTENFRQLSAFRAYLVELQAALVARLDRQSSSSQPSVNDSRMATFPAFPSLAPYDAAKENGTIALLSSDRLRIYNRIAFQREIMSTVRERWFDSLASMAAFQERFVDSKGSLEMGNIATAPNIATLSPAELIEYRTIVASAIKMTDLFIARLHLFDLEIQAVLDGVRDEDELLNELLKEIGTMQPAGPGSPSAEPTSNLSR